MTDSDRSKDAFEELYERTAQRLLVHLARRMQDIDAATELWCECWAEAYEGWARCRADSDGAAEAWVFGIARNRLAAYYRSGAIERRAIDRLRWAVPELAPDELAELEKLAALTELRSALAEALADLPVRRRRAIELRIVAGLPYPEVAEQLGCSEPAARAHVSRGLRRLGRALDRIDPTVRLLEVS